MYSCPRSSSMAFFASKFSVFVWVASESKPQLDTKLTGGEIESALLCHMVAIQPRSHVSMSRRKALSISERKALAIAWDGKIAANSLLERNCGQNANSRSCSLQRADHVAHPHMCGIVDNPARARERNGDCLLPEIIQTLGSAFVLRKCEKNLTADLLRMRSSSRMIPLSKSWKNQSIAKCMPSLQPKLLGCLKTVALLSAAKRSAILLVEETNSASWGLPFDGPSQ